MSITARSIIWWFAVLVTAFPVLWAALPSPSQIDVLLSLSTYLPQYAGIIYIGVNVATVALAEAIEIFALISSRENALLVPFIILASIIALAIIFLVLEYGKSVSAKVPPSLNDLRAISTVVGTQLALTFGLKLICWASMKERQNWSLTPWR